MTNSVSVSSNSRSNRVIVSSSNRASNVETINNAAWCYTQLARRWAIAEDIVDNEDYSSKYYAQIAKSSAEVAENAKEIIEQTIETSVAETVDGIIADIQREGNELKSDIISTGNSYLDDIEAKETSFATTYQESLDELNAQYENALGDISEAKNNAVQDVNDAIADLDTKHDTAVSDITSAKESSVDAVNNAKDIALSSISTEEGEALLNISNERNSSLSSISASATTALANISNAELASLNNIELSKQDAVDYVIQEVENNASGAVAQSSQALEYSSEALDKAEQVQEIIKNISIGVQWFEFSESDWVEDGEYYTCTVVDVAAVTGVFKKVNNRKKLVFNVDISIGENNVILTSMTRFDGYVLGVTSLQDSIEDEDMNEFTDEELALLVIEPWDDTAIDIEDSEVVEDWDNIGD